MSDQGQKRKRGKGWYRKQAFLNKKIKTGHRLASGQRGFLVTCNEHEKDAVKEAYNILNEYADKRYGPEEIQRTAKRVAGDCSDDESEEDIEKAIANEVQSLKTVSDAERRFQNCQTGARNCIFIKTTVPDPADLVHDIFSDLLQTKQQKSRYALRLLPVVGTCKGNLKSITALAEDVLAPFFKESKFEITYTIMFKARNNNGIGREMTVSALRQTIKEKFPDVLTRFALVNPELTILVEVMCGVGCISVVRDFVRFRKYNLVEVVSEKPTAALKMNESEEKADLSGGPEAPVQSDSNLKPDGDEIPESKLEGKTETGSDAQLETVSQTKAIDTAVVIKHSSSDVAEQQTEIKKTDDTA